MLKIDNKDRYEQVKDEGSGETKKRKDKIYVGGIDLTRPLTYNPPSDDELLKVAQSTYETGKNQKIQDTIDQTEKDKKSLYRSINEQNESADKRKESTNLAYQNAQSNLENQALKRGIQRSSMAIGGLKELESEKLNALNTIDSERDKVIQSLNRQIEELESDLGKEISKINENYANAVNLRLHELKKERDDKLNEVIKYNNTLDLYYPPEYYEQNGIDPSTYIDPDKITGETKRRIEEVLNDYMQFDMEEAIDLYKTNDSLKEYLGKYYDYVLDLLQKTFAQKQ